MSLSREQLAQQIVDAGRFLYGRGWSPATSSNYSTRLSPSEARRRILPDDVFPRSSFFKL